MFRFLLWKYGLVTEARQFRRIFRRVMDIKYHLVAVSPYQFVYFTDMPLTEEKVFSLACAAQRRMDIDKQDRRFFYLTRLPQEVEKALKL